MEAAVDAVGPVGGQGVLVREELDQLRALRDDSRGAIAALQARYAELAERQRLSEEVEAA